MSPARAEQHILWRESAYSLRKIAEQHPQQVCFSSKSALLIFRDATKLHCGSTGSHDLTREVLMKTYDDMGLGDPLIGSTIIDLEDRWHSAQWQEKMEKGSVHATA